MFSKYCEMEYMRVNRVPIRDLCPYTCGLCTHLPPPPTNTDTTTVAMVKLLGVLLEIKFFF
jgi:hypothetical protein